jgi:hypothetical protein
MSSQPVRHPAESQSRIGARIVSFADSLAIGLEAERRVGHDIFELGYWVSWPNPPSHIRGQPLFHTGMSDLLVLVGGKEVGLEVKSVGADFSGSDDFPFERAWVGKQREWERRKVDPWAVIVVSRGERGGRVVVPSRTRSRWVIVPRPEPLLAAPPSCWKTWSWLVERLQHPTV